MGLAGVGLALPLAPALGLAGAVLALPLVLALRYGWGGGVGITRPWVWPGRWWRAPSGWGGPRWRQRGPVSLPCPWFPRGGWWARVCSPGRLLPQLCCPVGRRLVCGPPQYCAWGAPSVGVNERPVRGGAVRRSSCVCSIAGRGVGALPWLSAVADITS